MRHSGALRKRFNDPVGHSLDVLKQRFRRFMNGTGRVLWINSPLAKVYVRKSTRLCDGKLTPCLDLASIDVLERYRKHGIMTKFSDFMLEFGHPVFVENVMYEQVLNSFLRRGYELVDGSPLCLIRRPLTGQKETV